MITNYCISPAPALRPYVNQYILSTSEAENVAYTSQWPAAFEVILIFTWQTGQRINILIFLGYQLFIFCTQILSFPA